LGEILAEDGAELSVSESGNYQMRVIADVSDCEAGDDIDILVIPITPEELILEDQYVFCSEDTDPSNNSVDMDAGAFTTFEWTVLNEDDLLSSDRVLNVSEAGVYEVTLSNGFTCVRDLAELIDDCLPRVYAPNVFAPNGVNNEFFVYPNPYVTEFEIEIYSRWGERIYQSNDIEFRWNGEYRGTVLQSGAYAYVMRFKSNLAPQLGVIEQSGGVMILK
jgi:gliding motility-associated-like protein